MKDFLLVGLGGFFGSIARYGIYLLSFRHLNEKAYYGTMIVNLVGCLLIGLLVGSLPRLNQNQSLLLITGLCGGFTTFSTFGFDGLKLLKAGMYSQFGIYFLVSTIGGLTMCFIGYLISTGK